MGKDFHACATCIHFEADKKESGMLYRCSRLGYETKPEYKFSCWEPKPHIKELMKKQKEGELS
ncbi:hypothetical protein [Jeotgalibacillus proteolyticus]|uniref:Uncharacterized protein n=1 Tax=Jeotgalibacillus proteolyticus TaxID=2082395 RepID=A0A2S5GE03_9BACL|nr:hypothetical protein [Jeotgalibacillus proteolyticus]PPA71219.1 hypothetical protein C4B60_03895 [Jeotgalibacillus proteolyticus]